MWLVLDGHAEPGQHGWLFPPQVSHMFEFVLHARVAAHQSPLTPLQQRCPAAPHATHMPWRSRVLGAVQPIPLPHGA
jgi:hypothetical protein